MATAPGHCCLPHASQHCMCLTLAYWILSVTILVISGKCQPYLQA
jgi:hypothetical protein